MVTKINSKSENPITIVCASNNDYILMMAAMKKSNFIYLTIESKYKIKKNYSNQ